MYAIISNGGRQFKVEQGQELTIDYRADAATGSTVTFDQVVAVSDGNGSVKLGAPTVAGASVTAEVLGPAKGPKLVVQKLRRRKNHRRMNGHRSRLTKVRISGIAGG